MSAESAWWGSWWTDSMSWPWLLRMLWSRRLEPSSARVAPTIYRMLKNIPLQWMTEHQWRIRLISWVLLVPPYSFLNVQMANRPCKSRPYIQISRTKLFLTILSLACARFCFGSVSLWLYKLNHIAGKVKFSQEMYGSEIYSTKNAREKDLTSISCYS